MNFDRYEIKSCLGIAPGSHALPGGLLRLNQISPVKKDNDDRPIFFMDCRYTGLVDVGGTCPAGHVVGHGGGSFLPSVGYLKEEVAYFYFCDAIDLRRFRRYGEASSAKSQNRFHMVDLYGFLDLLVSSDGISTEIASSARGNWPIGGNLAGSSFD